MKGLRVFRIGSGDWWDESNEVMDANYEDEMYDHVPREALKARLFPGCHRSFSGPERLPFWEGGDRVLNDYELSPYLHGAGPSGDRRDRMQYIKFGTTRSTGTVGDPRLPRLSFCPRTRRMTWTRVRMRC